jgi:hypothetical protein
MTDTPPRRGLRAAAVVAGVVAALGAAEALLRATHWGVLEPRQSDYHFLVREGAGFWVADPKNPPELRWDGDPYGRLPPGARATYALNSHGLRGPEPDPARPKVLFVGDSFTFGEGVAEEDTFAARVERALAPRFSPPPQSIAAGVPGYGSENEAARLPEWLSEFRPRAVVVVYVPNDPIPLDEEVQHEDLMSIGTTESGPYVWRLVRRVAGRASSDRAVEEWYDSFYFGARSERWDAARAALAEMKRLSTQAGARFGVVLFPLLHRLSERPFARIDETVAAACAAMGAPVLDLTPVLAREPDRALWVHPTDHHPDARAHELAAGAIAPFVESLLR